MIVGAGAASRVGVTARGWRRAVRGGALVWLAFIARATTDPTLAPMAEDVWRQLHDPLVARITEAIRSGELPAQLDAEREATRLQALIDGLVVHMVSAPRHAPPELALAVVDHHLAALRADAGPGRTSEPGRREARHQARRRAAQTSESVDGCEPPNRDP